MRFLTRYAALAALSPVVLLSACGSSEPDPPTPSPTVTVSPSVTASPTPTVPVMPEAAKRHTKAGAEAFVQHFWEVVNYAQETGDTAPLSTLSAVGCKACDAGVAGIAKVYDDGGRFVGGHVSLRSLTVEIRQAGEQRFAAVDTVVREEAEFLDFEDNAKDRRLAERTYKDMFDLIAVPGGWLVAQITIKAK